MAELIVDCALDALKDGALSIPILFIAYLLMETARWTRSRTARSASRSCLSPIC